ncbi:PAS domain-containing sensor histidine kinase [Ammoniphilus sp. YIM 78166]|uniref:PAS domain-containing sensor histidine kinase n=1 Tax=Ammoniphilus sp. YIM 78166 TaxID=1644106 RepID=UPI00106FADE7|nr:PAS domain-containing sensor histidine kinase [Ammoniphilus sp. YIM 78166]
MDHFLPHGYCFSWRLDLVTLHALSDMVIMLSYYSIPISILLFIRKKKNIRFRAIALLFILFIFLCGTTHFVSLITIWKPIYFTEGLFKSITAIVSLVTAIYIWFWMPKLLSLPTTKELEEVNHQLKEERDFIDAILHTMDALVLVLDPQGKIIRFNQACEKLTGYTAKEVEGKIFSDLLLPSSERESVWQVQQELLNGSLINHHQNQWVTKSGEHRLISWSNTVIREDHVTVKYLIGTGIDITHRAQMEKELYRVQQEFRETVRQHQGVLFKFKKVDGRFIYTLCEGALLEQAGMLPEKVIGKSPEDIFPPPLVILIMEPYERAWQGESPVFFEMTLNRIPCSVCLKPVWRDGEIVEVIGTVADMLERKQFEQELKEAKDQLESFFQQSVDGIMVKNLTGRIIKVNPALERMLGWKEAELLTDDFNNQHIPPNYRQETQDLMEKVQRGDEVVGYETIRQRKDGQLLTIQMTLSCIRDHQGHPVGISLILRDITEYKKTDELIRKWERVSSIGEMAASIAHEIRNPLTTLKGFVQFIKHDDSQGTYLQIMQDELNRIEMITNEFLMLAKPQAIQFKPISILNLLDSVIILANMQALTKSLILQKELSPEVAHFYVFGEENQLKQVLINLMKNAIEAMPENGTIRIRGFREENQCVLQVIDEGCGIPNELIPRLGEPFYTLKDKGTGLGLTVCYKIIKEHKGTIEINSHVGEGTIVTIKFPLIE